MLILLPNSFKLVSVNKANHNLFLSLSTMILDIRRCYTNNIITISLR